MQVEVDRRTNDVVIVSSQFGYAERIDHATGDRLDPALVRAGRCDVQVELTYAVDEQLKQSFKRFYKAATDSDAELFAANVRQKGGAKVTMSQLQEHFVQHRANPMEKAITDIHLGQVSETREYEGASSFYS